MYILIALTVVLAIAVVILAVKAVLMRRACDEIREQVEDRLAGETQSSFRMTTSDKKVRALASDLDKALAGLNEERNRLVAGDRDMRKNITAVSHDLRTPLTAISSYAEMLEGDVSEEERIEYLKRIRERVDELSSLTEELFGYSVSGDSKYYSQLSVEPVDLKGVIEDRLLSFYKSFEAKGITPEVTFCDSDVIVEYNRRNLVRVLDNVFGNAAKYASDYLKVSLESSGVITVINKAPELTPVAVSHLFDRYYTVDDGSRSTGLGLAIARELLESAGGEISAELNGEELELMLRIATDNISEDSRSLNIRQ